MRGGFPFRRKYLRNRIKSINSIDFTSPHPIYYYAEPMQKGGTVFKVQISRDRDVLSTALPRSALRPDWSLFGTPSECAQGVPALRSSWYAKRPALLSSKLGDRRGQSGTLRAPQGARRGRLRMRISLSDRRRLGKADRRFKIHDPCVGT
jgi:hypothetical protein